MLWDLLSAISVEKLPNRNCFGINSGIFVCVMVYGFGGCVSFGLPIRSSFELIVLGRHTDDIT